MRSLAFYCFIAKVDLVLGWNGEWRERALSSAGCNLSFSIRKRSGKDVSNISRNFTNHYRLPRKASVTGTVSRAVEVYKNQDWSL
jgi:hypothetical protein